MTAPQAGKDQDNEIDEAARECVAGWYADAIPQVLTAADRELLSDRIATLVRREVERARAEEREACAKIASNTICDVHLPTGVRIYGQKAAAAIRARSTEGT